MSQHTGGSNTPHYMDHVLSRFGHHLSPTQRTHLSGSVVPLQSAKQASFHYYDTSINERNSTPSCNITDSNSIALQHQQRNIQQTLGFTQTAHHPIVPNIRCSTDQGTVNTNS